MKKRYYIVALALLTIMLTACSGSGNEEIIMDEPVPAGAEDALVVELEFTADVIIPNTITIPTNSEILFVITNSDTVTLHEDHNLVAPEIWLKEILVAPGQTVRRLWTSYDQPGEYEISCTIHPWIDMIFIIE